MMNDRPGNVIKLSEKEKLGRWMSKIERYMVLYVPQKDRERMSDDKREKLNIHCVLPRSFHTCKRFSS
ncbi:hypothetical protein [Aneurinibacillus sp. REN35]|uniref:hypothetical protein n=1 Tax=Aneurinibacillus sp. REN35 TaxID=3237286 RepID=UPI0035299A1E